MSDIRVLTLPQIRELYAQRMVEDFPPDELKPLDAIEWAIGEGKYICYGFFDGEAILAYACFVRLEASALVDYYAVRRDVRDRGVGSRFLQTLIDGPLRWFDCVLLEVDDPDAAPDARELDVRRRRLRFYEKNGLVDTGARATVFHVDFRILALPVGDIPDTAEAERAYAALYRSILTARTFRRMVRIGRKRETPLT